MEGHVAFIRKVLRKILVVNP